MVLIFWSVNVTIQLQKTVEQYFPVVVLITLYMEVF